MTSPQVSTVIVAIIFALLAYFISSSISPTTPLIVSVIAFVSAFVAPLISNSATNSPQKQSPQTDTENIKTLYVGNLPYKANETAVRELFSNYGNVQSVRLMKDKHTGKRRGFGFVEISAEDIEETITKLNDCEFQQRTLKVREAKERPEKADYNT